MEYQGRITKTQILSYDEKYDEVGIFIYFNMQIQHIFITGKRKSGGMEILTRVTLKVTRDAGSPPPLLYTNVEVFQDTSAK